MRAAMLGVALAIASVAAPIPAAADGRGSPPGLEAFAEAMNRHDTGAALALFAPGGSYSGVLVCWPEPCVGRTAIGAALEGESADRTHHLLLGGARGELRCDSLAPLADRVVYGAEVDEGPEGITAMVLRLDREDAQTARVLAAVALVRSWLEDWAASGGDGPLTLPNFGW
jgi:hypothetical protein